jgi:hypothetical protein|tara:strand:- start:866 stop:1090 length:225 start_codon:yes stop_codon:yes gene_type:complete
MKLNKNEYLGPVILERINHVREDIIEIKNHLEKLNNQTFKNSEFRIRQNTINKLIVGFVSVFGVTMIGMVIKLI